MKIQLPFLKKPAILFALLFSTFAFNLNAQDCVTVNSLSTSAISFTDGSTVTPAFTSMTTFASYTSCGTTASGLYSGSDGAATIVLTFSAPYTGYIDVTTTASSVVGGVAEFSNVTDNTNATASTPTLLSGCMVINGNNVEATTPDSGGIGRFPVANTTSVTITFGGGGNGSIIEVEVCRRPCSAGATAPPLSATTLTNVCPTTTADLDALHTGTIPTGATLVWSTDNDSSDGLSSTVATPTAVAVAGTYYAYYHHAVDACYSPVSAGVVFTLTDCCNAGTDAPQF